MKQTLKFLTFCGAFIICSCGNPGDKQANNTDEKTFPELEKASWILGEWQNKSAEGNATEIWEQQDDSTFKGKSYFVIGPDTVSSEKLSLAQIGKDLFYIPVVKGQNNELPVKFKLTSSADNLLVFENPSHDFPQKITYLKISADSLLAEISGIMDGKPNSQKFPLARVK